MSRRLARESVYKLIFEYLFSKDNTKTFEIITNSNFSKEDNEYIKKAYRGVVSHYDELVSIIENNSSSFSLERIFKADMAALLLAIYEMKYIDEIPLSVSIAEAVELVKTYSTDKSNQYVNGLLSSVYKEIKNKEVTL